MQLQVYHPIVNVVFPPNAAQMNSYITSIATFDVWPTDDWFPPIFGFDTKSFKPLNSKFEENGFETQNFIMILGSLFCIFCLIVIKYIVYGFISCPCWSKYKLVHKLKGNIGKGLVWNEILEWFLGAYSEILIAIVLHSNNFGSS